MKFFDEVSIKVSSWSWWDGVIAWRREKHVPFWWPSWWDGWKWWSVILRGSSNERTLMSYRYNVIYQAKDGEPWQSREKYGKDAKNIELLVPLWTLVKNASDGKLMAHITEHDQEYVLAAGWRGWMWNMHFVSSTNQYPHICLLGEPGHAKHITLELQMLADVALVWTPSVGKSSLINLMSNVKAKTAEYHFTTLVPNLWILNHKGSSFSMIDIPGLISWAHTWKGLWNAFLRHILKSRVIVFVVDANRFESGREEFWQIFDELLEYISEHIIRNQGSGVSVWSISLEEEKSWTYIRVREKHGDAELSEDWAVIFEKSLCRVINKTDLIWDEDILHEIMNWWELSCKKQCEDRGYPISTKSISSHTYPISAVTWSWKESFLDAMMTKVADMHTWIVYTSEYVEELPEPSIKDCTDEDRWFLIQEWYIEPEWAEKKHVRSISHHEISYLVYVIPRWKDEAEMRFRRQLEQKWLLHWMWKEWAKRWDILKILSPYEWIDDRYILRE